MSEPVSSTSRTSGPPASGCGRPWRHRSSAGGTGGGATLSRTSPWDRRSDTPTTTAPTSTSRVRSSPPIRRNACRTRSPTPGYRERDERPSRVTFLVEEAKDFDGVVRLTVTHDDFAPGSPSPEGVSQGWSDILASLKTLLETGRPLPYA